MLSPTVTSASTAELEYIASADYGQDVAKHLQALQLVIHSQDGVCNEDQSWFPYEVIELVSHALKPGHEQEFAICTLLVIHNVLSGTDSATDLASKFKRRASDYDVLPAPLRDEILDAYLLAEKRQLLQN